VQRPTRRRLVLAVIGAVCLVVFLRAWDLSSQPGSGDGWRLLARQRAVAGSEPTLRLADAGALADAWQKLRLHGEPQVDFASEAVFWLTASGTIGCPSRLDDVTFDPADRALVGRFSLGLTSGCDHAKVPDSFLVAIPRARLPAEPFTVRLIGP